MSKYYGPTGRTAYIIAEPLIATILTVDCAFYCADGDEKEKINDDGFMNEVCEKVNGTCSRNQIENSFSLLKIILERRVHGDFCAECGRPLGHCHMGTCGKRVLEAQAVMAEDCVTDEERAGG